MIARSTSQQTRRSSPMVIIETPPILRALAFACISAVRTDDHEKIPFVVRAGCGAKHAGKRSAEEAGHYDVRCTGRRPFCGNGGLFPAPRFSGQELSGADGAADEDGD